MHTTVELLGGAFQATFEKGKKGKPGVWKFSPTFRKPAEKEGSMREQPQYAIQTEIEQAAVVRNQGYLKNTALGIVSFLKRIADAE